MRRDLLLLRVLSRFALGILPVALAIGGFLFAQHRFGGAVESAAGQGAPASAEMMQLLRDEHATIVDFLTARAAAQKSRLAAERAATARAVAEAAAARQSARAADAARAAADRLADASAPTRHASPRGRLPAAKPADPVHEPLVIAQANEPAAADAPNPIRAKTAELADNVVTGTRRFAAMIVAIPSWIVSLGERLGHPPARNAGAEGRFASASW
jgi:hypothetical protein